MQLCWSCWFCSIKITIKRADVSNACAVLGWAASDALLTPRLALPGCKARTSAPSLIIIHLMSSTLNAKLGTVN